MNTSNQNTKNQRIYFLDNAKLLLVFAVIFGHIIEPYIMANQSIRTTYFIIYSFHMPLFIFISGIFAKESLSQEYITKNTKNILIPLVVFTILYEILEIGIYNNLSSYTISLSPYWIMWFLYSLFIWKIILPLFSRLPHAVTISIILAIAVGYIPNIGYPLGISRTIVFFPFFLLGHKLNIKFVEKIKNKKSNHIIAILILIISFVFLCKINHIDHHWFLGSFSYKATGITVWYAGFIRLGIYSLSAVISLAILTIIPTQKSKLTKYGQNSLYAYLWHGFIIKILLLSGLSAVIFQKLDNYSIIIYLFIALVTTYILSQETIKRITQKYLFNPIIKIFGL